MSLSPLSNASLIEAFGWTGDDEGEPGTGDINYTSSFMLLQTARTWVNLFHDEHLLTESDYNYQMTHDTQITHYFDEIL